MKASEREITKASSQTNENSVVQTQLQKITTKMLGAAEIVHGMANWKLEVVAAL